MNASAIQPPLTNLQVELLKLFSRQLPDSDLLAIRDMIAKYLLEKAFLEADKAWESKMGASSQCDLAPIWLKKQCTKIQFGYKAS